MKGLSWNFHDRIAWSADEPATPEPEAALSAEPAPAAVEPAPELPLEPAPAPTAAVPAKPAPTMVPLRVMQERIGEETTKRTAAEERAAAADERARNFQAIVERLQAGQQPDPAATRPAAQTAAPAMDRTAIEQEARRQIQERDFSNVSQDGFNAYGQQWVDAINALNSYGANSSEFVANVHDIAQSSGVKTHDVMFQIAQDAEKAVQLARMTPTRQIAEITRMVMASQDAPAADPKTPPAAEPKLAAQISRAPAPAPRMAPAAAATPEIDPTTPDGNDKLDDKQFETWYKGRYMKRA